MVKLPKKRVRVLAKQEELGKLQARRQIAKQKPLMEKLMEHLEKIVDRIDPVELIAIGGATVIIYRMIKASEPLQQTMKNLGSALTQLPTRIGQLLTGTFAGEPFAPIIQQFMQSVMIRAQKGDKEAQQYLVDRGWQITEGFFPDWLDWLVSFTLAYIIIKHGGQLFGLAEKGLSGVLTLLLT